MIEPSTSGWASPVCLVKKPDGSYRFRIDYRRVNTVSRKNGYRIPDIQDALDSLRGAKWFATLDLLSGYWQLGMTDRAKKTVSVLHETGSVSILLYAVRTLRSACNLLQGNGTCLGRLHRQNLLMLSG